VRTIGEHLQKPHNAGSRLQALFFDTPLKIFSGWADNALQSRWAKSPGSGSLEGVPRRRHRRRSYGLEIPISKI
jgi:hypothetical protein